MIIPRFTKEWLTMAIDTIKENNDRYIDRVLATPKLSLEKEKFFMEFKTRITDLANWFQDNISKAE